MKRFPILLIAMLTIGISARPQDKNAIHSMIKRVLPAKAHLFDISYTSLDSGKDKYHIETKNNRVLLSGNNNISIAKAFDHYLRNFCKASVSWTGDQLSLPAILPPVKKRISVESPYPYRFYLNYCTFSYSMAFWDWKRWEKELDWMAMHGINLALAITGQEAVWQHTLRKLGYTEEEIKSFLCGPAFNAWWLMGNLEGWGGPVPQSWIDQQKILQQQIVKRMKELGIQPVLQGFYGMVPNSLRQKFPTAAIHDPGGWLGFKRPAMLMPTDSLFKRVAAIYYKEQIDLYGVAAFYQGDPFHEGGNAEGVDLPAAGAAIYKSMVQSSPGAKWVLQAWQNNPRAELLQNIPVGNVIITDIMAEAKPQWGGRIKYEKQRRNGYEQHHWIWSEIPNFGARTGMTGKMDSTNIDITQALHHPIGQATLKGIGATPEGIGQDGVIYDLLFDLGWSTEGVDLSAWLKTFVESRYGKTDSNMLRCWQVLRKTVYRSGYGKKDPPYESIFCARPAWNKTSGSTWGTGESDYDPDLLVNAWKLAIKSMGELGSVKTYRYDMVNITRQVIANFARRLYYQVQKAFEAKDALLFSALSSQFLQLLNDQDRLLSSQSEFLLGNWLEAAKRKGNTTEEKELYEWNARTLITTWTHELNEVNDYSGREWSGLLKDYDYPRWAAFFAAAAAQIKGMPAEPIDFFAMEKTWTRERKAYPILPLQDAPAVVMEMFRKYGNDLSSASILKSADRRIQYEGRTAQQQDHATFYWSGSKARLFFEGSSLSAILKDEKGFNYYSVILDGRLLKKFRADTTMRTYTLVDNLPDGKHTIELFKSTQWDKGKTHFYGFSVPSSARILQPPPITHRSIEFYGDSITSGSAVEDSSGTDSGESRYENNYFSYAAITARHYNAAYSSIARSGIGLLVSWFPLTMPDIFDRLDPSEPASRWDFKIERPHVVVVNLLQNDSWLVNRKDHPAFIAKFGNIPPTAETIIAAYRAFIHQLRGKYPQAKILCVLGNMDAVAHGSPWPGYITKAARGLDKRVMTHFFEYKKTAGHPNKQEQELMAADLISFMEKKHIW